MYKGKNLLLTLIAGLSVMSVALAQDTNKYRRPFFIPKEASFNLNSNFHWFLDSGFKGSFTDQINLQADLMYSSTIGVTVVNRTRSINRKWENKFVDAYVYYQNNFAKNPKVPIFKYGSYVMLKAGVVQWIPTFTNVQLIFENVDKFINPDQIYGASIVTNTPVLPDSSLTLHLGAHTGDLIHNNLDAELFNLFANYTKIFKYNLGVVTQIGIAQGSKHVVNFGYLLYKPTIEKILFDIRVGKLQTIDETPYGVHLGIQRKFKFITLGGYYERRLNQQTVGEIAGVSWSITGPPKLEKFISNFNFSYDFNLNIIWMWIPILKLNITYK